MRVGNLYATLDLDNEKFIKGLRVADVALRTFEKSTASAGVIVRDFGALITGVGLSFLASEAIHAGEEMINLQRRLEGVAAQLRKNGDAAATAAREYGYLFETAKKTGSSFATLADTYVKIAPVALNAGIGIDKVRGVLEGTVGAAAALGATPDQLDRAFLAINQVIGKGVLQMEELRQQIGEAIPNAMVIVAQGMTQLNRQIGIVGDEAVVTTGKLAGLIQASKVDAKTFVEAWALGTAQFKEFAEARALMLQGQMNVLATNLRDIVGNFMANSGINVALGAMLNQVNERLEVEGRKLKEVSDQLGVDLLSGFFSAGEQIGSFFDRLFFNNAQRASDFGSLLKQLWNDIVAGVTGLYDMLPENLRELGIIGFILMPGRLRVQMVAALATTAAIVRTEFFEKIAGSMSEVLGIELTRAGSLLDGFISAVQSAWADLDPTIKEIGLIGLILFGKKGLVAVTAAMAMYTAAKSGISAIDKANENVPEQGSPGRDLMDMRGNAAFLRDRGASEKTAQRAEGIESLEELKGFQSSYADPLRNELLTMIEEIKRIEALPYQQFGGKKAQADFVKPLEDKAKQLIKDLLAIDDFDIAIRQTLFRYTGGDVTSSATTPSIPGNELALQIKGAGDNAIERHLRAQMELKKGAPANPSEKSDSYVNPAFKGESRDSFIGKLMTWTETYGADAPASREMRRLGKELEELEGKLKSLASPEIVRQLTNDFLEFSESMEDARNKAVAFANDAALKELGIVGGKQGVETSLFKGAVSRLSESVRGDTPEETAKNRAAALEKINEVEKKAQEKGIDISAYANQKRKELNAEADEQIKRQRLETFNFNNRLMNVEIQNAESRVQAFSKAAEALWFNQDDPKFFKAMGQREAFQMGADRLDPKYAVFQSQAQTEALLKEGQLYELRREGFLLDIERKALLDDEQRAQRFKNDDLQRQVDFMRQVEELQRFIVEGPVREEQFSRERALEVGQRGLEILRERAKLVDEEYQLAMRTLEIEDMKNQQLQIRRDIENLGDPAFRMELVNLEMAKLDKEIELARFQADLAMMPEYQDKQYQLDVENERLRLAEMYYEYSLSMEQRLMLVRSQAIQSFSNAFSEGFTRVIMGQQTVGQFFQNLVQQMIGGIIRFFVQWAVQQMIAWVLGKTLLASSVASATAAAAGLAVAWAPAAVGASIATFGGAAAAGTAAYGASLVAATTMAATAGIAGGVADMTGIGGGAMTGGVGAAPYHDGGIFRKMHGGGIYGSVFSAVAGAMKADEGLALLQNGEMVVPTRNVDATIAAMQGAGIPLPEGVTGPSTGGSIGALSGGDMEALSAPRVQVVNYFDWDQVDAHLSQNPDAVLNVIAEDGRNRGSTSRRR